MRIISGKYKGHHLVSFNADHIRPTTDRVKESQFNILSGEIEGARVLDLFSGTGSLGLEALSRGASEVIFVDNSRQSIAILKKNIEKLKIQNGYNIINEDVLKFLKKYQGDGFDVIFIDPPFTKKMAHEVMQVIDQSKVIAPHSILTIESGQHEKVEQSYPNLERYDVREFGDKFLSFFRRKQ